MEDTGGAAQFDNATVDSALREAITDQDVDAVRRLLATPGYRFPATPTAVFSLVAAQSVTVGHGQSAHADPPNVCRRRGRDMLLALVAACDEDALCRRTLMHRLFLLRDDALFLRCLEYCWFLDPWKRYPSETDYRRVFETAATESES